MPLEMVSPVFDFCCTSTAAFFSLHSPPPARAPRNIITHALAIDVHDFHNLRPLPLTSSR